MENAQGLQEKLVKEIKNASLQQESVNVSSVESLKRLKNEIERQSKRLTDEFEKQIFTSVQGIVQQTNDLQKTNDK